MLTADQRFAFDVNGYQVIENALTPEQLATINAQLDEFVRAPTASDIGSPSGSAPALRLPLRLPPPSRLAEQG